MKITRLNDLYFPGGNEHGEIWEQYFKAEDEDGNRGYGSSEQAARDNLIKQLERIDHGTENQTC